MGEATLFSSPSDLLAVKVRPLLAAVNVVENSDFDRKIPTKGLFTTCETMQGRFGSKKPNLDPAELLLE
jgi:hypothetical protein